MSATIGFNNFKAFGEKMQTFSKKPITLIYGPNSIGKSSLLHSQLYLANVRDNDFNLNVQKINRLGDRFSLYGFDRFVHKHESNRKINYRLSLNKEEFHLLVPFDFGKIMELSQSGFFDDEFDIDMVSNKFNSRFLDYPFTFSSVLRKFIANNLGQKDGKEFDNTLLMEFIDFNFENLKDVIKINPQTNEFVISDELLASINVEIDNAIQDLLSYKDYLATMIVLTGQYNKEKIVKAIDFFKSFVTLQSIEIGIEFYKEDAEVISKYTLFFDNEVILTSTEQYKHKPTIEINFENRFVTKIYDLYAPNDNEYGDISAVPHGILKNTNVGDVLNTVSSRSHLSFNHFMSSLEAKLIAYIHNHYETKTYQYFGPLRFYPEQNDLTVSAKLNSEEAEKEKYELDLFQLKSKWSLLLHLKFLLQILKHELLPNKKNNTFEGPRTSEQIWKDIIQSEKMITALNTWLMDEKKLKSNYELRVNNEINEAGFFGKIFGVKSKIIKQLVFIDKRFDTSVTPREMGLGISQVLPILASCLSNTKSKMCIEQPELHLHPAVQCDLADEFIKSWKNNDNEFFIETHSEHLLLRIMKRMRQTAEGRLENESLRLTPDDVCLLYVDNDGDQTYIQELRLSPKGTLLDHWPHGFFEEGYKERFS